MYCDADSNDTHSADENEKQESAKQKKPKSTPFQGHGIGYHQGKTVVIKVNPEAKTYKITSTIPRYHVFDHFSTTPQALSPTSFFEGTGTAKEINYEYTTSSYNIELPSYDNSNYTGVKSNIYNNNNLDNPLSSPIPSDDVKTNDEKIQSDHSDESTEEEDNSTEVIDTVNEAIDRLGQIIKTHVYPSQTPDLDIYKIKPYNSELEAPTTKHEPDPEIAEVDEVFSTKSSFFETVTPELNIDIKASSPDEELSGKIEKENKTEIQFENNLNYPNYDKDISNIPDYNEHTYHKEHPLSSPYYKEEQEQLLKDEYSIYKYGYPMFMNFLRYKPQSFYNDKRYSKEIDLPYKSKSQLYNKYNDSDEKDFENIYTGLIGAEDVTKDKQKEEIESVEEPTSTEVESSYRTSYPLQILNKVKEEVIETPNYDSIETLDHPENKGANSSKGNDEFLGHTVPLQNKWDKVEENENGNNNYNKSSYTQSAPSEKKDSFLQKLHLLADLKSFQILGKIPMGDTDAYHLFGVLVPVKQGGSSILKTQSSEDNT